MSKIQKMSIKSDVLELESIRAEIKSLAAKRKELRKREKVVEERIIQYLEIKEQPGLKHHGTAIILEQKEARERKKAKERDMDAKLVLERYGISDADRVLAEVLEARKGNKVPVKKLKIKKYKETDVF